MFIQKIIVSTLALGAITLNYFRPDLLTATTVLLLVVAVLPWISSLVKSVELPGGLKIEFQDLEGAAGKVKSRKPPSEARERKTRILIQDLGEDPALVLVAVRIEIERRLRELARRHHLDERQPLATLFHKLRVREVFDRRTLSGIQDLVNYGNQAAHGMPVAADAIHWAEQYAPGVLEVLDQALGESAE